MNYVLYERSGGTWGVQCVPIELGSFTNRKRFPKSISGLRDDELSNALGIDGCIFVHSAGFIGGNKTFEGALKMAVYAQEAEATLE